MAYLRLLLIVVFIGSWFTSNIDTASIKTEDLEAKISDILKNRADQGIRSTRAIQTDNESLIRYCYNTPCGWEVYKPFTRRHEYFMKNTCECPDNTYKCVRTNDDLSVSAYVYRCRQNTTAEDIEPPENAS